MVVGGSWQWVVVGVFGACVGRRGCVGRLCWEGLFWEWCLGREAKGVKVMKSCGFASAQQESVSFH